MPTKAKFLNELSLIQEKSPMGFAIAFQIRLTTPSYLFQTYAQDWQKHYSEKGLVMYDPTVLWGFENDGVTRWSDLKALDTKDILGAASQFGMTFGMTWANGTGDSRSIGSFTRSDREYTEEEMNELATLAQKLHEATLDMIPIDEASVSALLKTGIRVSQSFD